MVELNVSKQRDPDAYIKRRLFFLLKEFDVNKDGYVSQMEKMFAASFSRAAEGFGALRSTQKIVLNIGVNKSDGIGKDEGE